MSSPYLGEIRCFSFNFAPEGWALCNGQLLPINQYQALFSLLGTNYGGNGTNNFQLPNMQGRVPAHWGDGYIIGATLGEPAVTLNTSEIPAHTHAIQSVIVEPGGEPERVAAATPNAYIGPSNPDGLYSTSRSNTVLASQTIGTNGSSQPHNNLQPFLVVNFCIALTGIFPSES
jgi:microcystin-dependent protein